MENGRADPLVDFCRPRLWHLVQLVDRPVRGLPWIGIGEPDLSQWNPGVVVCDRPRGNPVDLDVVSLPDKAVSACHVVLMSEPDRIVAFHPARPVIKRPCGAYRWCRSWPPE
jgi:hypothetical protein